MSGTADEVEAVLASFMSNQLDAQAFCTLFENLWNLEARKDIFSDQALRLLNFLFDEVVLFSPYPRREWGYPRYRDGDGIREAASQALQLIRA